MRPDQVARVRQLFWEWRQNPPPCGISVVDVYNPCLPEDVPGEPGKLWCLTCGMRQRLALEAAR